MRLKVKSETRACQRVSYSICSYILVPPASPFEWVSIDWLTKWLQEPTQMDKVANKVPLCPCGKVNAEEVTKLKCISSNEVSAIRLSCLVFSIRLELDVSPSSNSSLMVKSAGI